MQGTRTYFHYADEGLIGEYDSTGAEIKTYGYKPGSTWTTDPLFLKENGQYYFYHNDHLGTPQKITAVNGAVVWSAKYESFGKANIEVETVENNLRFPGQYFDHETGLHYNWFRFYEPDVGRYLKIDPLGLADGVNLFAYAANNPIVMFDPRGRNVLCLTAWQDVINDCGDSFAKEYKKKIMDARNCDTKAGNCLCGFSDDEEFCKNFEHCRGKMGAASCTRGVCVKMKAKLTNEMLNKAASDPACRKVKTRI